MAPRVVEQIHDADGKVVSKGLSELFQKLEKSHLEGKLSINLLTYIMGKQGRRGNLRRIELMYHSLPKFGMAPTAHILNSMVNACANAKNQTKIKQYLELFPKHNLSYDIITYQTLITCEAKRGNVNGAIQYYEQLKQNNFTPSVEVFGSLIYSCVKSGSTEQAEKFYREMATFNLEPNTIIFNTLISACRVGSQVRKAEEFFEEMMARKVAPNHRTFVALITAARDAPIEYTDQFLSKLKSLGLGYNVQVITAAIASCSSTGNTQRAEEYFDLMRKMNIKPNVVTFHYLIATYYQAKDFVTGDQMYRAMVLDYKIRPNRHINALHRYVHDYIQYEAKQKELAKAEEMRAAALAKKAKKGAKVAPKAAPKKK